MGTLPWRQQCPPPAPPPTFLSQQSTALKLTGALSRVCVCVRVIMVCVCVCISLSFWIVNTVSMLQVPHDECVYMQSYPPPPPVSISTHILHAAIPSPLQVFPFAPTTSSSSSLAFSRSSSSFICLILSYSSFPVIPLHIWARSSFLLSVLFCWSAGVADCYWCGSSR